MAWARRATDEAGAGLIEYALLVALIAVLLIGSVLFFSNATGDLYCDSVDRMADAGMGEACDD